MTNQLMTKQVTLLLTTVRRRQRQSVEARVAHLGLSSQQFWILEALYRQGMCSLGEILATLPMDQPTASRVLAVLHGRALVRAASDTSDRRRRCLRLTASGMRLGQRCAAIASEIRTAITGGFSHKELAALHDYLDRMVANLERLGTVAPSALRVEGSLSLPTSRSLQPSPSKPRPHSPSKREDRGGGNRLAKAHPGDSKRAAL
jgi:DNA-binding MarR family transcriptional regulator